MGQVSLLFTHHIRVLTYYIQTLLEQFQHQVCSI